MNTARDLLGRLLSLFPVKLLKSEFLETGNAEDVIDAITGNKTQKAIKDFVYANHDFTRQNIYLFTLNNNFNRGALPAKFPFPTEKDAAVNGEHIFFCLPQTTFSVYLSNPTDKEDLLFYQPVIIRVKNKHLIIQYTKLEKNVNAHYLPAREAKKASEDNSEEQTLAQILTFFEHAYTVTPNDINKGIKHLWHIDDLDCHKISWRNPHSISTETMDGTLTFKQKYPAEYKKIILTPISGSIWKYLLNDDYLCEGFTSDLTAGHISITRFPKLPNQVNNVITKILANN
ncbi:MAG TPA: hypothetical protein PKC54_10915 [Ferruginibacter sp.]|nr:hypothetical protein [Ferruginibacter sp.]